MITKLILASRSSGRKMILKETGIDFEIDPSEVDEEACTERDPVKRAELLACMKAKEVAERHPENWVLGADTVVVAETGELLEKPVDEADARRMIELHNGKKSAVITGMCLIPPKSMNKESASATDTAYVTFQDLHPELIDGWIASGKWKGCSGGFRLEKAEGLVSEVEGDRSTVIGLSMPLLMNLVKQTVDAK